MVEIVPLKKIDIRETPLDGGVVLYNPRTDEAHLLNPAAMVVWECCTGEHTLETIARLLRYVFRLEGDLGPEVDTLVQHLREMGLLSLVSRH